MIAFNNQISLRILHQLALNNVLLITQIDQKENIQRGVPIEAMLNTSLESTKVALEFVDEYLIKE